MENSGKILCKGQTWRPAGDEDKSGGGKKHGLGKTNGGREIIITWKPLRAV